MINVFSCISYILLHPVCLLKKKKKEKRGKEPFKCTGLIINETNGDGEKKTHNPPREQLYS